MTDIKRSRADCIRSLTEMTQQLVDTGDTDAADIAWQAVLRIANLNRPGPDKIPLRMTPLPWRRGKGGAS